MKMKVLNGIKTLMKKRISKILLAVVLCGVTAILVSSALKSDSVTVPEYQVVTVQRGDLTVDITASGNLALSVMEDLAFEISGTAEEVIVDEGDSVEEGQVLARLDTSEWDEELTALERDLLQAEINLENAELSLKKAEEETTTTITGDIWGTTTDPKEIDIKELQVELTEARLEDAQKALEEALDASPEIIAPFAGFIISVNVEGGDEVLKGTVAVELADPSKFEADILVSEMDILQVKLGGEAWVQVDALQGMSLPAEVTHVSPTATIQSGVVNYKVKVELQSLETIMQEGEQARQDLSEGELPERLKQAIEEGLLTQEEAEEMMKQRQQEQGEQQGAPPMIFEDFQLREGLTVTVSIMIAQRKDVLLVPNGAITTQGGQTYVQVVLPDDTIEDRAVTIGISNWQYTEVTDGLSEGEKVVVLQGTTTPSAPRAPRGPMPFIPGH